MNGKANRHERLFIREWCEIKKISMRELARRCPDGPTIGSISRYNDGNMQWSRDNLMAMARALDIPPEWLLSADAVEHHQLLAAWRQLSPGDRQILMDMIASMVRTRRQRPPNGAPANA